MLQLRHNKHRETPRSTKRRPHFETCTCLGETKNFDHGSRGDWSHKWLCWWRPATINWLTDWRASLKQQSYKIIRMNMFAAYDIFAAVKLKTIQVTKLPLYHKISKIGMICFAKPGLTEDLYIVQKQEFSITCYMCDMYTWQRHRLFIRDNLIHSLERMLHKDYDCKGSVEKKNL
jgi:hypothetical protein